MAALVETESLVKHFPLKSGQYIAAVNDVSFTIERGETLGLVGESGSGKTTVGRCLLRLIEPTAGRIVFGGQDVTRLPEQKLRALRRRIGLVFQEPFASLNPRWTVRDIVEEPLVLEGRLDTRGRTERLREIVRSVDLGESHLPRYPRQLTASEQQRVGIARALVTQPDLIVLDEPTSLLDQSVRAEILDVLIEVQNRFETAYLFISHDLTAVERLSHRIAIMYLGRIVETGTSEQIFARQHHPYSRALLSAVLYPDPHRKLEPFLLKGEIPSAINPKDQCPLYGRCPIGLESCTVAFPPFEEVEVGHQTACYRWREFVSGEAEPVDPATVGGEDASAEGGASDLIRS